MSRRTTSRKLSAATARELQVAAAVAREAVQQLHVEHALELIRCADGQVSDLRMLDIYLRLLDLTGPGGDAVANRVLASLGRTRAPALGRAGAFRDEGEPEDVVADDRSLLRLLRRRLRGRVHHELRRTVELRTGVVHAALLDLHSGHALGFVGLLADTHTIGQACSVYTSMVQLPPTLAAMLYVMVLDRIAANESPAAWRAAPGAAAQGGTGSQGVPQPRLSGRAAHRTNRARSSA
jgi:hypothetical protein